MTGPTGLADGVWGVLATPFTGDALAVDDESLRREVRLYADLPATGLVVLGVFGEAASLAAAEAVHVVEVVRDAGSDLPLVVGLPSRTTPEAVEEARRAVDAAGPALAAVMVQVPTADPAALGAHLQAVHDASGAPVVVQDYPVSSGVRIGSEALLEAVRGRDFVAAVKSESPPTAAAVRELTDQVDLPVFGGLGGVGLLDELAAGAAGAMTGFSHPEGLLAAVRAHRSGGPRAAREAFLPWLPLAVFEAQPGVGLAVRKELLRLRGVFADAAVRPPAPGMPDSLRDLTRRHYEQALELMT